MPHRDEFTATIDRQRENAAASVKRADDLLASAIFVMYHGRLSEAETIIEEARGCIRVAQSNLPTVA